MGTFPGPRVVLGLAAACVGTSLAWVFASRPDPTAAETRPPELTPVPVETPAAFTPIPVVVDPTLAGTWAKVAWLRGAHPPAEIEHERLVGGRLQLADRSWVLGLKDRVEVQIEFDFSIPEQPRCGVRIREWWCASGSSRQRDNGWRRVSGGAVAISRSDVAALDGLLVRYSIDSSGRLDVTQLDGQSVRYSDDSTGRLGPGPLVNELQLVE